MDARDIDGACAAGLDPIRAEAILTTSVYCKTSCGGDRPLPLAANLETMQSKHLNLLINCGAVLVGLIVVGYVAYSAIHTEVEQPCSSRYPAPTRFSLQTGQGKPLSAIELQARAGLRDLGVIDNAAVVRVEGGPSSEALEVKLRKLRGSDDASDTARNGIEFRWSPPGIAGATSACLSYSVWFPDKFAFGGGGVLPGVFGGVPATQKLPAASDQLSITPQWDYEGKPVLAATVGGGDVRRMLGSETPLPTERWIPVQQEVILNAPGQANGVARLWIDGTLIVDDQGLQLRKDAKAVLAGVLVAAGYRRAPPEPGMLRFSPFEIAWR
ncbi:MAG: hypothetical protein M5U16_13790 [Hyphomicrobium sp.]|nr:hypothetical protein [Hyphomicrobium sp.]